jgi:hypothetical protein
MAGKDDPSGWEEQIPYESRSSGPYEDFGWERGTSVLPEFRDPSVHLMPYERGGPRRPRRRGTAMVKYDPDILSGRMGRAYGPPGAVYGQTRFGRFARRDEPGPYYGRGPRNYQRSDTRILEDIADRLTQHGWIDASQIEVDVNDGTVTLSGMVNSREEKRLAEDTAYEVYGVADVRNELRIAGQAGRAARGSEREYW